MLHTPSEAIGSVVPIYGAGDASGGSTGPTTDIYEAAIVVGNALAGDTTAICNYLDPGDGTGIAAAFTAAAALAPQRVDIRLRRGTYTLSNAVAIAGLALPAGCSLVGAGIDVTTIVGAPASTAGGVPQTVLDLLANTQLRDLTLVVPDPAGANDYATRGSVGVSSGVTCRHVKLVLGDNTGTTDTSTPYGFLAYEATAPSGVLFDDVEVAIANVTRFAGTTGFYLGASAGTYTQPTLPNIFRNCRYTAAAGLSTGIGIGTSIHYTKVTDFYVRGVNNGIWLTDNAPISGAVEGLQVDGLDIDMTGCTAAGGFGVSLLCLGPGSVASPKIWGARVTNARMYGAATTTANARAVYVQCGDGIATENLLLSHIQGLHMPAGGGGVEIWVNNTASSSLKGARLNACDTVGDLTLTVGAAGTASNTTFVGNECRNLAVAGATGTNAIVGLNRITGAYTDTGTGTTISANIVGP